MITIVVLSFVTLILVSQTMFSLYNSVSNLGLLNLGSVAATVAIDQIVLRPIIFLTYFTIVKMIQHIKGVDSLLLQYSFIVNLCEN